MPEGNHDNPHQDSDLTKSVRNFFNKNKSKHLAMYREIDKEIPVDQTYKERQESLSRTVWKETTPLSPEDLAGLINSQEFSQEVVEAINKTGDPDKKELLGQEFGLVVFHHPGNNPLTVISPLFGGDERSIKLHVLSEDFKKQVGYSGAEAIVFHTHPDIGALWEMLSAVLQEKQADGIDPPYPEHNYFSVPDLTGFKSIAETDNASVIYALGTKTRYQRDGGRLVLLSFNNFDQLINFDPEPIVKTCREFKKTNSKTPLDIYKQFGLNAAALNVNLDPSQPAFNPKKVASVAQLLTRRFD